MLGALHCRCSAPSLCRYPYHNALTNEANALTLTRVHENRAPHSGGSAGEESDEHVALPPVQRQPGGSGELATNTPDGCQDLAAHTQGPRETGPLDRSQQDHRRVGTSLQRMQGIEADRRVLAIRQYCTANVCPPSDSKLGPEAAPHRPRRPELKSLTA
jgi:hypothetical protein